MSLYEGVKYALPASLRVVRRSSPCTFKPSVFFLEPSNFARTKHQYRNLVMNRHRSEPLDDSAERLLAELTVTAHSVALRHGRNGSFVDLQMALWEALRGVVAQETVASAREEERLCCFA
jgi:hypothetical protein